MSVLCECVLSVCCFRLVCVSVVGLNEWCEYVVFGVSICFPVCVCGVNVWCLYVTCVCECLNVCCECVL